MMRPQDYLLVVEDDEDIREVLVEILTEHGYPTSSATNGREALALLESAVEHPCLVLLDQIMPIMTGEELIKVLATIPALAKVPICVLTADVLYTADGTAGIITKPIDENVLLDMIRRHCGPPPAAAALTSSRAAT